MTVTPNFSGQYNFTLLRNDLVTQAFYLMNKYKKGQQLAAEDLNYGVTQLNNMITSWESNDIFLWKYEIIYLFLQYAQSKYVISPTSNDHSTLAMTQTILSNGVAAGSTVIPVVSTIGMNIGDNFGIVTDSNFVFWSTIATISGNMVTINTPLSQNALQGGNVIFDYTSLPQKPQKMKYATLLSPVLDPINNPGGVGYETQLVTLARKDYQTLSVKGQPVGYPSQVMYEPRAYEGWLWVAQCPQNTTQVIKLNVVYPFQSMTSANNNAEFPSEWTDTLVWNLAKKLIPAYGVEGTRVDQITKEADMLYGRLLDYDMEDTYLQVDISVFPNRRWGR